mgnify:CR=1 FL=1
MPNSILIYRIGGQGWVADMSDAVGCDDFKRLFGTVIMPLPYAASAAPGMVRARIAALNPDAAVWLRDE